MAIKVRDLRNASVRSEKYSVAKSLNEALTKKKQTAFLCHSHLDLELAKGLQTLLNENGWDLYIDWEDSGMPSSPNEETARLIQLNIKITGWFIFLATKNSTQSRWCPWEIGYADATKGNSNIIIIPTEDDNGKWYGNEYLKLYKKIDEGVNKQTEKSGYAMFEVGSNSGTWVENIY